MQKLLSSSKVMKINLNLPLLLVLVIGGFIVSCSGTKQPTKRELSPMTQNIDGIKYRHGNRTLPYIALTFDDGPHPTLTPKLLDILASERVLATFYVVGKNVLRYPSIMRRIENEGHEIGNHSHSHCLLKNLPKEEVKKEVVSLQYLLKKQLGHYPETFRPPYGAFTFSQAQWLKKDYNLTSVHWDVDPLDWKRPSVSVLRDRLVSKAQPGSILLLHDIHPNSVTVIPSVIKELRKKGYQFVTVSELLKMTEYEQKKR